MFCFIVDCIASFPDCVRGGEGRGGGEFFLFPTWLGNKARAERGSGVLVVKGRVV